MKFNFLVPYYFRMKLILSPYNNHKEKEKKVIITKKLLDQ